MSRLGDARKFDVAVLGGGPAGAAVASALIRRGYSTVVIEQSDYREARVGETLPPAIGPLLTSLGMWDQFLEDNHTPSFGIRSAWGSDDFQDNDFIFNPYGNGWHDDVSDDQNPIRGDEEVEEWQLHQRLVWPTHVVQDHNSGWPRPGRT